MIYSVVSSVLNFWAKLQRKIITIPHTPSLFLNILKKNIMIIMLQMKYGIFCLKQLHLIIIKSTHFHIAIFQLRSHLGVSSPWLLMRHIHLHNKGHCMKSNGSGYFRYNPSLLKFICKDVMYEYVLQMHFL